MTTELEIFEDLVGRVIDGSYDEEIADVLFIEKCNELKEDAEIYASLHPNKSGSYLVQRKLIIYRIITKMANEAGRLDELQKTRMEFIEKGLLSLYWLYMELLVEIKE